MIEQEISIPTTRFDSMGWFDFLSKYTEPQLRQAAERAKAKIDSGVAKYSDIVGYSSLLLILDRFDAVKRGERLKEF